MPEIPINFLAEQLLRVGGRRRHLSCSDGLTFFAVKILHRLSNPSRSPFGSPPFDGFLLTWGSQTPMRNRLRSVWTRLDFHKNIFATFDADSFDAYTAQSITRPFE